MKRLAGKPRVARTTLLGEIGFGVSIASFHCKLSCGTKSCKGAASKAPPDSLASGNMITDQQTRARRGETRVYAPFLSLRPHRTVSKELNNIQPKSQPSLDAALPWSLDTAACGRVLFGASPDGSSHHLRFQLPRWDVSPPLESWRLCWQFLTSPGGRRLLPTAILFLPPRSRPLSFLCSWRTALFSA